MDSGFFSSAHVPIVDDELEQLVLKEIARRARLDASPRVLDLPCGKGRRAVEMAKLGAHVLAAGEPGLKNSVQNNILEGKFTDQVRFCAVRLGHDPLPEGPFDLVFCHHGINFLPYEKAARVLRELLKSLQIGGKLFVSAYGLHSALSEGYADGEKPVAERFCPLAASQGECYGIKAPVCLYTERNLVTLLIEIGSGVLRTFTSTHGTVKGVAVRI
jgi:SAM-dependent methyltransferase